MKISVALLRQGFQLFSSSLKNWIYAFENQCCVVASPLFSFFFSKFYRCVSKLVWHCCMRKDFCIRRKLSFFGGRILMCENQCCVVASAFSAFFFFLQKLDICVRKPMLHGCIALFQFFSSKFDRCVSISVWQCCMRKDFCTRRKLSFFGSRI